MRTRPWAAVTSLFDWSSFLFLLLGVTASVAMLFLAGSPVMHVSRSQGGMAVCTKWGVWVDSDCAICPLWAHEFFVDLRQIGPFA